MADHTAMNAGTHVSEDVCAGGEASSLNEAQSEPQRRVDPHVAEPCSEKDPPLILPSDSTGQQSSKYHEYTSQLVSPKASELQFSVFTILGGIKRLHVVTCLFCTAGMSSWTLKQVPSRQWYSQVNTTTNTPENKSPVVNRVFGLM